MTKKQLYNRAYKLANRTRLKVYNDAYRAFVRWETLRHYSGGIPCCACCGESTYEFLSIDHVNGGGNKHRKELRSKYIYSWLRMQGWPSGYQVLCHNCNMAKAFYKKCPHKELLLKRSFDEKEPINEETSVAEASSSEGTGVLDSVEPQDSAAS